MRAQRSNLEDQVGGLLRPATSARRSRWRGARAARTAPWTEPQPGRSAAPGHPSIRAQRASDAPDHLARTHRDVA